MLETIIKVVTVIIALLSTITAVIAIKQSAQLKNKDLNTYIRNISEI